MFSGVPRRGEKARIGYLTPAFSRAQKRAEMLRNPFVIGGPQSKGDKIRIGCLTGVPRGGDKIKIGYLTPAFSGAQKRAELLHNPCILGGP